MKFKIMLFVVSALLLSHNATAATEYLRFEGLLSSGYDEFHPGYDAALGFVPGQSVYFDFQVDTSLDVTGNPDSDYQDKFSVIYLTGSLSGPNVTYGVTNSFPEGYNSELFITNSLRIGSSWDSLANPSDESISTWNVGDTLSLMNNSYFSEYIIGNFIMTYRGSSAPTAYAPVPAAIWLFDSGLLGLIGLARYKARA